MLALLLACAQPDEGPVGLPDEDTAPVIHDSSTPVPLDTAPDTGLDQTPAHTLSLHQEGLWQMSPFGGPYEGVVGELWTWEYLDGTRPVDEDTSDTASPEEPGLRCETRWTLVGQASEELCESCEFAFDIRFTLLEGDRDDCLDPDLPADGQVLRFGYDTDDDTIYQDFGGAGLWLPWWTATRAGDELEFDYDATMGVVVEEER